MTAPRHGSRSRFDRGRGGTTRRSSSASCSPRTSSTASGTESRSSSCTPGTESWSRKLAARTPRRFFSQSPASTAFSECLRINARRSVRRRATRADRWRGPRRQDSHVQLLRGACGRSSNGSKDDSRRRRDREGPLRAAHVDENRRGGRRRALQLSVGCAFPSVPASASSCRPSDRDFASASVHRRSRGTPSGSPAA